MRLAVPLARRREPPPAWQRALDRLAPPHPRKSRLVVRWLAGDVLTQRVGPPVWDPIERWVIWELIPTELMSARFPAVRRKAGPALEEGLPFGALHGVRGMLELDRRSCIQPQWDLWLETGCYGRMVWIIQGTQGGHQRTFSEWQRLMLSRRGLPEDPPYPGQLPYAPLDNRVLEQLLKRRQAKAWEALSARAETVWHTLEEADQEEARQARIALADWAEDQLSEVLDSATRRERAELRELYPAGVGRPDNLVDADEAVAAYIEGSP